MYSEVDIKTCGLYRYATDPSFEILLIAWATDDGSGFGETQCCDLATGDPFPAELLEAFQSGTVRLIAHNASFERVCFSVHLQRHFPGQYLQTGAFLSPENWLCTMVMAGSLTLPLALKDVGEVLKTVQQKDKEGERLIKLFSMPCKPTKSNGYRTRNLPQHYPADWVKFKGYCIQDVNTEIDIYKRLKRFPMPDREWHHYRVNERVNDRGVKIDTELVQQAIACDLMLSDAMTKKAYELTGLENPNSVSQLKSWLDERGIPMDSLGKKDVAQMIGELDKNGVDEEAMDMLKLRLQMAKSSVKKYQAAERCVCPDRRARGLFQFYGASRTGRYSGRNIQLQNLPQNHISTLEQARDLVKMGCFDMVESIYGNTPDVLSQLIRTMLVPKEGCEFIVADFSAIEARVLAWEAEEQWVLDAFQNGEDLYCATASQMFHVPVVKHGVKERKMKNPFILYKKLPVAAKASLWFLLSTMLNKCMSLITVPLFTRIMDQSQYGLYSTYQSVLSVVTVFCTMNFSNCAYINGYAKFETEKEKNELATSLLSLDLLLTISFFLIYETVMRVIEPLVAARRGNDPADVTIINDQVTALDTFQWFSVDQFTREGNTFTLKTTTHGIVLGMKYSVQGGEIYFDREEKSVTRSSVIFAGTNASVYIKNDEVTVEDATGQQINRPGRRIRGVVGDFGHGVGNEYYVEKSMTELRNLTRQEWQTRLAGQMFSTGEELRVTPYEELRRFIQEELGELFEEEAPK